MHKEHKDRKDWYLLIDALAAAVLLVLDQLTKHLAVLHLKGGTALVLLEGVLELQYVENTGVAFSLFRNGGIFITATGFLVLGAVLFVLFRVPRQRRFFPIHMLMALLVAGAAGNLVDRLHLDYVVDFISFVLIHFPVFNVADCYIVVSAFLLCFLLLFRYREEELAFLSPKRSPAGER